MKPPKNFFLFIKWQLFFNYFFNQKIYMYIRSPKQLLNKGLRSTCGIRYSGESNFHSREFGVDSQPQPNSSVWINLSVIVFLKMTAKFKISSAEFVTEFSQ